MGTPSPSSVSTVPGGAAVTVTETIQGLYGFSGTVAVYCGPTALTVTVTVPPASAQTCSSSVPASVGVSGSSPVSFTLTVSAPPGTAANYYPIPIRGNASNLNHMQSLSVAVQGFTLTWNGQVVSVVQGKANLFAVAVTSIAGFSSPVTVTASTSTSGLSVSGGSVTPTSSGKGVVINLAAALATTVGTASITLNASGGGVTLSQMTIPAVTVAAAQPDFLLSNPYVSLTVTTDGRPSTFTETITPIDGLDPASVGNLSGPYPDFSWPGGSAVNGVLTIPISATPLTALLIGQTVTRNVTFLGHGLTKTVTVGITVVGPSSSSGFSIQPAQATVHVGAVASTAVTTSVVTTGGFNSSVGMAASAPPTMAAAPIQSVLPDPTGAYATDINSSTSATTPTGNQTVTVTGTGNSQTNSAPITHVVHAPSAVTMAEYDNARTGANPNEWTLTPDNVMGTKFGLLWAYNVDGCVWAHPLPRRNVVVGTEAHQHPVACKEQCRALHLVRVDESWCRQRSLRHYRTVGQFDRVRSEPSARHGRCNQFKKICQAVAIEISHRQYKSCRLDQDRYPKCPVAVARHYEIAVNRTKISKEVGVAISVQPRIAFGQMYDAFSAVVVLDVYGTDLTRDVSPGTLPLPTVFGNTSVELVDMKQNHFLAPLLYVSPSQINFVVPDGMASGIAIVNILRTRRAMGERSTLNEQAAPGYFTLDGSGHGAPVASAVSVDADGNQTAIPTASCTPEGLCTAAPIPVGSGGQVYLSLYGTGFRHAPAPSALCGFGQTRGGFVTFGSNVTPSYFGPQSTTSLIDQINIPIPPNTPMGSVDVSCGFNSPGVGIAGIGSNIVTITVQ